MTWDTVVETGFPQVICRCKAIFGVACEFMKRPRLRLTFFAAVPCIKATGTLMVCSLLVVAVIVVAEMGHGLTNLNSHLQGGGSKSDLPLVIS